MTIQVTKAPLTDWGYALNGAASMTVGLIPTHPLFTIKTHVMSGQKVPPIHRLWSGYCPNAGSGAITEGLAFAVYRLGTKMIHQQDNTLSDTQNLGISIVAGSIGAPFNASLEQGMIRQQLVGGKFSTHIKKIYRVAGMRGVFKGC